MRNLRVTTDNVLNSFLKNQRDSTKQGFILDGKMYSGYKSLHTSKEGVKFNRLMRLRIYLYKIGHKVRETDCVIVC